MSLIGCCRNFCRNFGAVVVGSVLFSILLTSCQSPSSVGEQSAVTEDESSAVGTKTVGEEDQRETSDSVLMQREKALWDKYQAKDLDEAEVYEAFLLFQIFLQKGDVEKAEFLGELVFEQDQPFDVGLELVAVKLKRGKTEEAERIAAYLTTAYPKEAAGFFVLGAIYEAQQKKGDARAFYKKAWDREPKNKDYESAYRRMKGK